MAGHWREILDVGKILRKDDKILQIQMYYRIYSLTIS